MKGRGIVLAAAWLASAACSHKPEVQTLCDQPPNSVLTIPNARYGVDSANVLDLYLPWHRAGEPVVLFVHGGGWTSDDKHTYGHIGRFFAACGMAFANVNYQLAPRVRAAAQASAVLAAARWLTAHGPVYGYAGDRLFLMGHSAGAEIVTLAALGAPAFRPQRDRNIRGVVVLAGMGFAPSRAQMRQLDPRVMRGYRAAFGPHAGEWLNYDVERRIPAGAAPFLIARGVDDDVAPEADSQELAQALAQAGVPVSYLKPAGRDHTTVLSNVSRDVADPTGLAIERFILTGKL